MEERNDYICTRPLLAAELMRLGFEGRETVNPWKPSLVAWLFELNSESARIVAAYYAQIGQQPPAIVCEYVKGRRGNENS